MRKLLQRGDTIVEVLIAMTVASSVLAVTYATMNRNLTITRASQERTEAGKLAQGQLEALKARNDNGSGVIATTFCIDEDGAELELPADTPNISEATPALRLLNDDFSQYISPTGDPDRSCVSSELYHYGIREMAPDTYRIYVRWDRVGGGGRDEVIMVYKL